jgi:hypothetical protein
MQIEKLRAALRDPLRTRRKRRVTSCLVVLVRSPELSEFIAVFSLVRTTICLLPRSQGINLHATPHGCTSADLTYRRYAADRSAVSGILPIAGKPGMAMALRWWRPSRGMMMDPCQLLDTHCFARSPMSNGTQLRPAFL